MMTVTKEIDKFFTRNMPGENPHRMSYRYWKLVEMLQKVYGLKPIGQGSGRIVLALNNDRVLKLAKNRPGMYQNLFENSFYQDQKNPVLAPVLDCSRSGSWLIARRAKKLSEKAISKSTGLDPVIVEDGIYHMFQPDKSPGQERPTAYMLPKQTEFGQNLFRLLDTELDTEDIADFGNDQYGLIDEKPVVIDYGLSKEIGEKYYYPYN